MIFDAIHAGNAHAGPRQQHVDILLGNVPKHAEMQRRGGQILAGLVVIAKLKHNHHSLVDRNCHRFLSIQLAEPAAESGSDNVSSGEHDQLFKQLKVHVQRNTPLAGNAGALFHLRLAQSIVTRFLQNLLTERNHIGNIGLGRRELTRVLALGVPIRLIWVARHPRLFFAPQRERIATVGIRIERSVSIGETCVVRRPTLLQYVVDVVREPTKRLALLAGKFAAREQIFDQRVNVHRNEGLDRPVGCVVSNEPGRAGIVQRAGQRPAAVNRVISK